MTSFSKTAIIAELLEVRFRPIRNIQEQLKFLTNYLTAISEEQIKLRLDNFKTYRKMMDRVFISPNVELTEADIHYVYINVVKTYESLTLEEYKQVEKQYRCKYSNRNRFFKNLLLSSHLFDGFDDERLGLELVEIDRR